MKPIISLKNINKIFQDRPEDQPLAALQDINLVVQQGEIFVLLGPSGCGKSTLLRIISGLEKSYQGKVIFHEGLSHLDTSFVFQQFALLPWLTVWQNVELGLIARNINLAERKKSVSRELKLLGLEKFSNSFPKELSGGMKQRVGIARALATDPKVIFMDEPFSELDSFTAEELRNDLLKIWQERGPTIILVTHNISEAIELGDRIGVMSARPGMIKDEITNQLTRPRSKRSPEFFALEDKIHQLIKI